MEGNTLLFETLSPTPENFQSLVFTSPLAIVRANSIEELPVLIASLQSYLDRGLYAAGYFGYECGYAFEQIAELPPSDTPIAWFGIYEQPEVLDERENRNAKFEVRNSKLPSIIRNLRSNLSEEEYCRTVERVQQYIREGDIYQANFTMQASFTLEGSPDALYQELRQKQRVPYAAFMKMGNRSVLSLSPELFFRIKDGVITTRPMKGTVRRGKTPAEDEKLRAWLQNDEKNRAENLMIVDLLRNDIGRIAEIGSVQVDELFHVERYDTLFQMTSTVSGRLRDNWSVENLLRALFPCGSVTGAPKIRAMQIIHELEQEPRGLYTGAIGYFHGRSEAVFSVAIRTIVVDGEQARMGIGSGIVHDSVPQDEYAECLLKAKFLTEPYKPFSLIESLLWDDGYPLLELHLQRLKASAEYFGFECEMEEIRAALTPSPAQRTLSGPLPLGKGELRYAHNSVHAERGRQYKVRVVLDVDGTFKIEHEEIMPPDGTIRCVAVSPLRVHSGDRFLYHKTTRRDVYEEAFGQAGREGLEDVILLNERDEVTEGTRNNILIRKGDAWFTPPIASGLLGGVHRQHLLSTRPEITERVLYVADLTEADEIFLCNAVRGLRKVELKKT